jgi:spore germination cell wall hydrolase CwlJ-like protein
MDSELLDTTAANTDTTAIQKTVPFHEYTTKVHDGKNQKHTTNGVLPTMLLGQEATQQENVYEPSAGNSDLIVASSEKASISKCRTLDGLDEFELELR